jgi:hypothetical protein
MQKVASKADGGEESAEEKKEPRLKYSGPETLRREKKV